MKNRKILIVTYYWPPSGGVGVQRWMNYALALQKEGWEPIIYTPQNPQFEIQDRSVLEKVKNIRVIKTKIWEPFRFFHALTGGKNKGQVQQGLVLEKKNSSWKDKLAVWVRGNLIVPDPRKYWVKSSVRFLVDFIRKEEIDAIITTGPPHSMHLIGLGVKTKLDVKWIADFRDPWSKWDVMDKLRTGTGARKKHRRLERKVLTIADKTLTVSRHLKESLESLGGDVHLLYNGVSLAKSTPKKVGQGLTIGYYGMLNEMRNPSELWRALEELANDRDVELRLGGIVSESIKSEINDLKNLSSVTKFLGYLDHDELPGEYANCNILLLLLNRTENAKWIIPVKFFEYLSARRNILALGPADSDLAELAQGVTSFKMLDFEDEDGIREAIADFENQNDFKKGDELLERFSHARLSKELEEVIRKVHG